MAFIITPQPQGWGNWKDLAEQARITVLPPQRALGDELIDSNPCENVEEERFDVHNPRRSCEPRAYFESMWGIRKEYKTLHPLPVLSALSVWGSTLPRSYWSLVSPHLLADGKGRNFIFSVSNVCTKDGRDVLQFLPVELGLFRPAFIVGLTPAAREYCSARRPG